MKASRPLAADAGTQRGPPRTGLNRLPRVGGADGDAGTQTSGGVGAGGRQETGTGGRRLRMESGRGTG